MRAALIAYSLGIYLVSLFPELSDELIVVAISVCLCFLLLAVVCHRDIALIISVAFVLGVAWHLCWALGRQQQMLPSQLEGHDLLVEGRVIGLPQTGNRAQSFTLVVTESGSLMPGSKLQLSYFTPPQKKERSPATFRPGDRWQLTVRLKQVHGFANPGNHDREAFLFRNGFAGTGYVRGEADRWGVSNPDNRLLGQTRFSISALRGSFLGLLETQLQTLRHSDLIVALVLGEKSKLGSSRWELFSATGTNHLFVISGLHIGLITLFSFSLYGCVIRLIPARCCPWPTQRAAAGLAMLTAVSYSLMAGWGLPTQRACIMILLLLSSYLTDRRPDLWFRFLVALAAVLSLDPLATTSMGFWLSFLAVAALLFSGQAPVAHGGTGNKRLFSWYNCLAYGRAQWAVFVGLFLPLTVLMGQIPLLAPIANLIAIPVLGFILLPLLLIGTVLLLLNLRWAEHLLSIADSVLHLLIGTLQFLAELFGQQALLLIPPPSLLQFLFIVPGILLLLLPIGFPFRILTIPLLVSAMREAEPGEISGFEVHVLDVGQGLSVLIRTENHSLLYDTGPAVEDQWSAGSAVVVPALRHMGINKLDRILVSHGDMDHAGGLPAVSTAYPGAEVVRNDIQSTPEIPCAERSRWVWDRVVFTVLHPLDLLDSEGNGGRYASSNNRSCVLQIRFGEMTALLPGDIEAPVERLLAATLGTRLQSSVLIAPHHGSNTSSSYPFLKMVAAEQVIFSSGYGNGFGHPAAPVVQRYIALGAELHDTAQSGMISLSPSASGEVWDINFYRKEHRRYWGWSGNPLQCRYC